MSVDRPPIPTEDRLPAWRRACLAYREMRQAGATDQEAHEAAQYECLAIDEHGIPIIKDRDPVRMFFALVTRVAAPCAPRKRCARQPDQC
jgi:hypothetical protein